MKKNSKRLSLALLALGLSSQAFAYSCCMLPTVPNQQGGFSASIDAYLARPSSPDNSYAVTVEPNPNGVLVGSGVKDVNPTYNFAFDASISYRIPCTGNDISATWTHVHESNDNAREFNPVSVEPIESFPTPDNNILGPFDIGGSSVKYNYDAVDVDFGQRVMLGCQLNLHLISGVRWAEIEHKKNSAFDDEFSINPTVEELDHVIIDNDSDFKGVGPQFGVDAHYCLIYGFGLQAGGTFSLLVGQTHASKYTLAKQTFLDGFGNILGSISAESNAKANTARHVVPALDAFMGLDYTYNFYNCARSSFVVQAGYKIAHYFGGSAFIDLPPNSSFINHDHGVSFDGPYAGLKINL